MTEERRYTGRIKTNEDLDNLIEHKNVIHFIKDQKLRWLGHLERMPEKRDVKSMQYKMVQLCTKWLLILKTLGTSRIQSKIQPKN